MRSWPLGVRSPAHPGRKKRRWELVLPAGGRREFVVQQATSKQGWSSSFHPRGLARGGRRARCPRHRHPETGGSGRQWALPTDHARPQLFLPAGPPTSIHEMHESKSGHPLRRATIMTGPAPPTARSVRPSTIQCARRSGNSGRRGTICSPTTRATLGLEQQPSALAVLWAMTRPATGDKPLQRRVRERILKHCVNLGPCTAVPAMRNHRT